MHENRRDVLAGFGLVVAGLTAPRIEADKIAYVPSTSFGENLVTQ